MTPFGKSDTCISRNIVEDIYPVRVENQQCFRAIQRSECLPRSIHGCHTAYL